MRPFPTRAAVDLSIAGCGVVASGLILREPPIVAWGGCLLIGLAIARSATLLRIFAVRRAGFEMSWRHPERRLRVRRAHAHDLFAELRNKDDRPARFTHLRVIASSSLRAEVFPSRGEVAAGGRLTVRIRLLASRVGQHGVYALSLELQESTGLFEVPLTFANPIGIEVVPGRALPAVLRAIRLASPARMEGPLRAMRLADGGEFAEIREHHYGDSLRKIAWKASAKRGRLMVREYEPEESSVLWFLLDASIELWSGPLGEAPLDVAIDAVAARAEVHLERGDEVGLVVAFGESVEVVSLGRGKRQLEALSQALALVPDSSFPGRTGLDEEALAARVYEHVRTLHPARVDGITPRDLPSIRRFAEEAMRSGPYYEAGLQSLGPLWAYSRAYGVGGPPRVQAEYQTTQKTLGAWLRRLARSRRRPSRIYVASPMPDETASRELTSALQSLRRRGIEVRWMHVRESAKLHSQRTAGQVAERAAELAAEVRQVAGARRLRQLGVAGPHEILVPHTPGEPH